MPPTPSTIYFIYGPEMDQVIHGYRDLTGHAPLYGRWGYGFVQSKDRYKSAKQLLDIAQEYRDQHVPLDFIVQDWYWWKLQGDPEYNDDYVKPWPRVPDALDKLHAEHVHAMISVWAKMDPRAQNWQEMQQKGLIVPDTDLYDATNPVARDFYWDHLMGKKFAEGWDGFWLDSSEPEIRDGFSDASLDEKRLFIGNGARYTNIFPLMHSGGVYDHWRRTTDRKRVFILTRSGFLGQQRNATTVWSGDVIGTWMSFQRQIPAGLNFELSGLPYWTTDIAGYGWPYERDTRDPDYQELYTRWYEFGVLCPIFRTHGHRSNDTNEIFSYGPQTPTLIAYDRLRSRMLPYIYSLAWRVTSEDYTMMRPLVMDWRENQQVRDIGDEYTFGSALLVSPVSQKGATSRPVYLPPAAGWYDFWTGAQLKGDQHVEAQAPLDRIPLYVRAGSILPLGPEVEYAEQSPDAPLELRIYRGADGSFTLYNDQGDTYAYEKGDVFPHTHPLGRCFVNADTGRTNRKLSRHADPAGLSRSPRAPGSWRRFADCSLCGSRDHVQRTQRDGGSEVADSEQLGRVASKLCCRIQQSASRAASRATVAIALGIHRRSLIYSAASAP